MRGQTHNSWRKLQIVDFFNDLVAVQDSEFARLKQDLLVRDRGEAFHRQSVLLMIKLYLESLGEGFTPKAVCRRQRATSMKILSRCNPQNLGPIPSGIEVDIFGSADFGHQACQIEWVLHALLLKGVFELIFFFISALRRGAI